MNIGLGTLIAGIVGASIGGVIYDRRHGKEPCCERSVHYQAPTEELTALHATKK